MGKQGYHKIDQLRFGEANVEVDQERERDTLDGHQLSSYNCKALRTNASIVILSAYYPGHLPH